MGPLARILRHASIRTASLVTVVLLALPSTATRARGEEPPPASAEKSAAIESPRYRLEPIVVTPNRLPLALDRIPSDVTVITQARLERERPFLLADALRWVPGIEVQRSGALGKLTDVRLRGADPRHTLVLFDGIPLNGPWLGSFDFADLMGAGVGQVEIFGGPASSLYGSGASGGVVQILSAAGAGEGKASFFAEYGEEKTLRQGFLWRGSAGAGAASVALTRLEAGGRGPRDGYTGVNGQLHVEIPVGRERVRVTALATQGEKELPYDFFFDAADPTLSPFGSYKEIRDPNNHEKDRVIAGSAAYTRALSAHASLEAELSGFAGMIQNQNPPNAPSTTDYQRTNLDNGRGLAALRARVTPTPSLQTVLGGEYRSEGVTRLDDSNYGGFGSVTSVSEGVQSRALYAQTHVEVRDRLLVDAGIRLEDHSRYGAYGVPRVALGVLLPEAGLKLRAGYGRAFTAPTLTDLFYPGYGSPTLNPERSSTWEAGVDGTWLEGTLTARATQYTTRFHDLIQSNSFFVAENVGRARIEGEEYAARFSRGPRFSLEARAAHLLGKNVLTGERLAKRPEWRGGILLSAGPVRGLVATADWWWAGSMRDPFVFVDAEGRVLDGDTPGRAVLDLGANISLTRWLPADLRLRVGNALDRKYFDVKGFPARARALTVGVTVNP